MISTINPIVIREVQFARSRRGYRAEDVKDFLARVADAVEVLNDETDRLESALTSATGSGAEQVLAMAQSTAEQVVTDANRRAVNTLQAAQRVADDFISEANRGVVEALTRLMKTIDCTVEGARSAVDVCDRTLVQLDVLRADVVGQRERLSDLAASISQTSNMLGTAMAAFSEEMPTTARIVTTRAALSR